MNSPVRRRDADIDTHFETRVRADLGKRRWLRVHVFLIGIVTFLSCWGLSSALFHLGIHSIALRHAGALLGAYGVYLLLLWVWAHYLLGRGDAWDLVDGGAGSGPSASPGIRPGGGDFGGGGASAAWTEATASGSAGSVDGLKTAASGTMDALSSADEGAAVAIPAAILLLIATLLATVMGFAVFGLFGIEVLMGVAVEIAFASAGGAMALKARREGWMSHAIRRTAGPMAAVLVVSVLASLAISTWMPDAKTLPDAIRLITDGFRN